MNVTLQNRRARRSSDAAFWRNAPVAATLCAGVRSIRTVLPCSLATLPSALALLMATAFPAKAQKPAQARMIDVRIGHAVEVAFQSVPGQVYVVESSVDNASWFKVGDPWFGDGSRVVDLISYRQTGERSKFFRVRVEDASKVGIGPVSLAGNTYLLNDGGEPQTLRFLNAVTGVLQSGGETGRNFRYGYLKTGPKSGRLQMLFGSGEQESETVVMSFETDSVGSFQSERHEEGVLEERDAGTFSRIYIEGDAVVDTGASHPAPGELAGYALILFAGDQSSLIRVLNDTIVKESTLNTSASYTYDYAASQGIGRLSVRKGHEKSDFYEFRFTSLGTGDFKRTRYADGKLKDADAGVFSVFGMGIGGRRAGGGDGEASPLDADAGLVHFPEDGEPETGGNLPPEEGVRCEMPGGLEGICVEVNADGESEKLCFYTDGTGSLVRDFARTSVFLPFDYSYEAMSERVGKLVVEFATREGNERVVYELQLDDGDDGCSGSYARTAYSGDRVTGQSVGRFTMRAELIVPDAARPGGAAVVANPNRIGLAAEVLRKTVLRE